MKERGLKIFLVRGTFVLLAILLFNVLITFRMMHGLDQVGAEAKERAKPAEVEIIVIDPSCAGCFDVRNVIEALRSNEMITITNERILSMESPEAAELAVQSWIKRFPAVLLKGDIGGHTVEGFVQRDDMLVFDRVTPPYFDVNSRQIRGEVETITITAKTCAQCKDLRSFTASLRQNGISVRNASVYDAGDAYAQRLIERHNIRRVPAVLVSGDIEEYPVIERMRRAGIPLEEGYYIVESRAPYVNVSTGSIRGLVQMILVTDERCLDCYDVQVHKKILESFGLAIAEENTIDINSVDGMKLRAQYKLEKVPTVILRKDIGAYEGFDIVWQRAGTIEADGAYVFRDVELIEPGIVYRNIKSGEIIQGRGATDALR